MKIRLLSDLHLELSPVLNLNFKKSADVVILAGDIGNPYKDNYINLLRNLSLTHSKVFVTSGNHEYYNQNTMTEVDNQIKNLCSDEDDIHFLQMESVIYNRVKFTGCTLWTHPTDLTLCKYMNDFNYISADEYVSTHLLHKNWLENDLAQEKTPDYGKVCVVTHHLPLISLTDPIYMNDPLNPFFASDINTTGADIWCYGHTHKSNYSKINNVDYYCNPKGYDREISGWDIDCIFEINC